MDTLLSLERFPLHPPLPHLTPPQEIFVLVILSSGRALAEAKCDLLRVSLVSKKIFQAVAPLIQDLFYFYFGYHTNPSFLSIIPFSPLYPLFIPLSPLSPLSPLIPLFPSPLLPHLPSHLLPTSPLLLVSAISVGERERGECKEGEQGERGKREQ